MTDPRKAMFAAARAADADGVLTPNDVAMIDAVLDFMGVPRSAPDEPSDKLEVSEEGVELVKQFEGCHRVRADGMIEAYPDPGTGGDPWTIGWGATGPDIKPGTVWSQTKADARLIEDIDRHAEDVRKVLGDAPTSQPQFDALVSFHYNTGAIARATLTKLHKAGQYAAAAEEFARWNKAGGRVLKGLVRRRSAEAKLYRAGS